MPLFRNRAARRSPQSQDGITVEVTVEIQEEDPLAALYDTSHPMADLPPRTLDRIEDATQALSRQEPSTNRFTETVLDLIAQDELSALDYFLTLSTQTVEYPVLTTHDVASLIRVDSINLLRLGQQLALAENPGAQPKMWTADNMATDVSPDAWMMGIEPLRGLDPALFHILRGSLNVHTPLRILVRWDALSQRMSNSRETLTSLVRHAEQSARHEWPPTILELYFLLLDHNDALVRYTANCFTMISSMESRLSAYCIALRLQFYLWRMLQSTLTLQPRTPYEGVQVDMFSRYARRLSVLAAQELARLQDPESERFQNVTRELISKPVKVEAITRECSSKMQVFCTICQDEHAGSECVSPLACSCIFGRDCLQPLLNRDMLASYTCPNCRSLLHEPLEWRSVMDSSESDLAIGLSWSLRSDVICLQREIEARAKPPTSRGWVTRLKDWLKGA